ncbi:response regulator transcription factor [Terriglobus roseus]|uniref:Two-component system, OmpR family, KDP operon response regulator KdpE n=1 Tax=Terriglobus roseus TaxID=392734 RepID=A0A1H4JD36_9BACT|nr:response regulator transcription factor [Terriglobus roseus]SEB43518.1 two-component system, OmpR family, KDP operon response regulator KdpE [Terriglobus roseus]
MSRILIVDDEPQILRMLRASLTVNGYEVVSAKNGLEGFTAFEQLQPDLIITDMSMPVMDGLSLTREIRRISKVPIIVLSVRNMEPLKVDALDAGADDYVTKPFTMPELLARVRAHLRRVSDAENEPEDALQEGDFSMDFRTRTVSVRQNSVHLTPKEFDLLHFFLKSPDRVLTHRSLAEAVWGTVNDGQTENLRVLVAQLRRKIEDKDLRYIVSEPWVGYALKVTGAKTSL